MLGREKEGVINMKRDQRIVVRLTKEEKDLIVGKSKELNINCSDLIREGTLNYINNTKRIYIPNSSVSKTLAELCDLCNLVEGDLRNDILYKLGELECQI